MWTHRPDCELWRIVVDVGDGNESCGCVGESEVQVPFHICGLDNEGVLRYFLWTEAATEKRGGKKKMFLICQFCTKSIKSTSESIFLRHWHHKMNCELIISWHFYPPPKEPAIKKNINSKKTAEQETVNKHSHICREETNVQVKGSSIVLRKSQFSSLWKQTSAINHFNKGGTTLGFTTELQKIHQGKPALFSPFTLRHPRVLQTAAFQHHSQKTHEALNVLQKN